MILGDKQDWPSAANQLALAIGIQLAAGRGTSDKSATATPGTCRRWASSTTLTRQANHLHGCQKYSPRRGTIEASLQAESEPILARVWAPGKGIQILTRGKFFRTENDRKTSVRCAIFTTGVSNLYTAHYRRVYNKFKNAQKHSQKSVHLNSGQPMRMDLLNTHLFSCEITIRCI